MDAEKKRLRDEVAELSEAAPRAAHHCHCMNTVWTYPLPGCAPYQPMQILSGTVTSGGYTATNADSVAAGGGTTYVLSLGN